MTDAFDFTGYTSPPPGFRVVEATLSTLRLYHEKDRRTYSVLYKGQGIFELSYDSRSTGAAQFIMRSDDLGHILGQLGGRIRKP